MHYSAALLAVVCSDRPLATAKAICKDYRSLHNVEIDRVPDEDG
jgi:hypothetical protein